MFRVLYAKNRVHQRREVSEVDAANRSVELIQRIWLAALQGPDSGKVPVVGEVRRRVAVLDRVGNIHLEVRRKHMRAVEVRGRPGVPQVAWVVAREEQSNIALFIKGMA